MRGGSFWFPTIPAIVHVLNESNLLGHCPVAPLRGRTAGDDILDAVFVLGADQNHEVDDVLEHFGANTDGLDGRRDRSRLFAHRYLLEKAPRSLRSLPSAHPGSARRNARARTRGKLLVGLWRSMSGIIRPLYYGVN